MDITKHYDGQIELVFDEKKHTYKVGENFVDGVTSVVGVVNKPALIYWSANMAAQNFAESLKNQWDKLVTPHGPDEIILNQLYEDAKKAHRRKATSAADIGTLAHKWCEQAILWKLGKAKAPKLPSNEEARNACNAFKKWVKEHDVKFIDTEFRVYSRKYNYAGTCDFEAEVEGELAICDLKTSSGIYQEMFWQTAAYQGARTEEFGTEYACRHILRIGKDGSFDGKRVDDFEADYRSFLACLHIYRAQKVYQDEKRKAA